MTAGLLDPQPGAIRCPCGTEVAPGLLACPGCHRLIHAELLKAYQAEASAAAASGDVTAQLTAWRLAIALVPPASRQHAIISAKVSALSEQAIADPPSGPSYKWLGGLGAAGLLAWKFKFLVVAIATKGKLLLFGLTKSSTLFSMLLSFGVYWTAWGMWFALGVVVSIYVHEMGHVAALRRFGVPATAPMFVPGLGAFIRMRGLQLSPAEDARIGLAGPVWGLGAALAALAVAAGGGGAMWIAIARTGAWLNAFNLLPVWHLDGSRGIAPLSRQDRWLVATTFVAGWAISGDGLFVLLALVMAGQAFAKAGSDPSDRRVLSLFIFLIIALATILRFAIPAAPTLAP